MQFGPLKLRAPSSIRAPRPYCLLTFRSILDTPYWHVATSLFPFGDGSSYYARVYGTGILQNTNDGHEMLKLIGQAYLAKAPSEEAIKYITAFAAKDLINADPLADFLERYPPPPPPGAVSLLTRLENAIDQPSENCLAYRNAILRGDLTDYLPTQDGTNIHPGAEGVRPGNGDVHPSLRPPEGF
jgi:hypothetical protein